MKRSAVVAVLCCAFALGAASPCPGRAQGISADLVGRWDGFRGQYSDVWGAGNYAYLGHYTNSSVSILDITDPAHPRLAAQPRLSSERVFSQDLKVAGGLLFVALDRLAGGASGGVVVVDVRDPTQPRVLTVIDTLDGAGVHNVFHDAGYLYLVDSERPIVSIVDLTAYDPDNPPATITTEAWRLTGVGHSIVHDITVAGGRLYAAAWSDGLWIYDVRDIATGPPRLLASVPGRATHSVWPTADGKFVVTGEERRHGGLKVYRVTESGGSLTLQLTDRLSLRRREATSVHNLVIVGNRLYASWYEAGLRVYDIDPVSGKLLFVASYDTDPGAAGDFFGAWGVFPFLGPERVLVSDIRSGLFVIDAHGRVHCSDIEELRVLRCGRNGTVRAKVRMTDRSRDRQKLTFSVGNGTFNVPVRRRAASLKACCFSGPQTVTLVSPAGCFAPVETTCP